MIVIVFHAIVLVRPLLFLEPWHAIQNHPPLVLFSSVKKTTTKQLVWVLLMHPQSSWTSPYRFFFFCTAGLLRGWLRYALVIDKGQQNPFGLTNNILTMPRQSVWLSLHVKSCAVAGTDTTGHVIWIHSWMLTNQHLGEILVQSQEAWGTLL